MRLRTLADVFAYAEAAGIRLRIDGAETLVRRPKAGRAGRRAFVSGKTRRNTIETTPYAPPSSSDKEIAPTPTTNPDTQT